jgi:thiol:disulfide interchange protein DsbD
VHVEAYASHERIHAGDSFQVAIIANIKQGLHINSHQPIEKFLVPTVVKFDETKWMIFGPVAYPQPQLKTFSFSTTKLSVYDGKISIFTQGQLSDDISTGDVEVSGLLAYQACDDKACFMPTSTRFKIPLKIVNASEQIKLINKSIFRQEVTFTADEMRAKQVIEKGIVYAVIAFFLFGLALNLTPCVYPVIPITISFFASQSEQRKWAIFVLASHYVAGIAIVFSILGLISGLAGRQWGFMFQNPWFVIVISIIILSLAANMFGAFELRVPSFLMARVGASREGAMGSFLMGLTVGVVIAPCAAGIVIGLVGIVAKLGMVVKGGLLFFVMGLGLGMPYLFLAHSSALLNRLPRSGMWLVLVRKLFGVLLIGVALYFLVPQAKHIHDQQRFYLGVLAIFGGLLLGFLERDKDYSRAFNFVRGIFGCLVIFAGVFFVGRAMHAEPWTVNWIDYDNQPIQQLTKRNKPILIHFTADWCAACKELDSKTFGHRSVVKKSRQWTLLRVDCTLADEKSRSLIRQFRVTGLPTLVFINASGEELHGLRTVGFVGPSEMLKKMEQAAQNNQDAYSSENPFVPRALNP